MIIQTIIFIITLTNLLFGSDKQILENRIIKILSKIPSSARSGVLIYNPLNQDTLFKLNIEEQFIPASITKLYTSAVSLEILSPDFKIKTKLLTDDPNIKDSIVDGNIYIKGYGNPLFSSLDLERFADKLYELGIYKITGDIVGDDSYFDNIYRREDWIDGEIANIPLPPISALILDNNKKTVLKKLRKRQRAVQINILNPPLEIASKFKYYLINKNILIKGNIRIASTPEQIYEIEHSSIELKELLKYINKYSNNYYSECLFKIIGAEFSKIQGTYFYAQQAIKDFLKKHNIPYSNTEIVDGSGISKFNKVTISSINSLLEKMYFDLNSFDVFYNSLSISGIDGTLKNRIGNGINFRGKTGTLRGVIGLAGYLRTKNGDDLIVTILFEYNKGTYNFYRNIQDEIINSLDQWYKSYSAEDNGA